MAVFAWLPLFLLQLFSAILGMDLHYIPAFRTIEVFRWQQPICTSASPCNTYESRHYNVDQVQKVLNVREIRDRIDIDDLEPSTIASPVIYEKLYAPEHSDDARSKRHFSGRHLPNDPPPAILVTRVIDSPVMATIVGRSCIDGVPSCADGPIRVPIQLPPQEEYLLQRTLEAVENKKQSLYDVLSHKKDSVVQTFGNAVAGQHEFVAGFVEKKQHAIQEIIDEVSHKKDAVVQAVESVKQSIVDELSHKKDAIVGVVSSAAAAKHEFVQGIIDKKREKVQPIIDAVSSVAATKYGYVQAVVDKVHEKKEQVVEAVSGAAAAKHEFVEGIVEKKKEKLQAVKDKLVEAVSNAAAAKQEFVEGIVEKKKEKIQAVVDKVHEKKDQIVAAVSGAAASKLEFIEGIAEKKHEKLQEKKDKIVEAVSNVAASKQEFVEGIVEKKKEKIQAVVDEVKDEKDQVVEAVSNAAAAKHEFIEGIVEKKHEKLQQKKDEIVQAASSIVQGAIDKKHEKIQGIKDSFSTLSAEKQAAVQKVVNKTKQMVHEFEAAKEKAEQELTEKKQAFVQSVADKKIEAIKHISEKTQEYIGTASLVKPLIVSQIKQAFNKNEQQFAKKTDEGDDFVFVDEDQKPTLVGDDNGVQGEQTQGRSILLLKKFILMKKIKPFGAHNESTQTVTPVEEPARPVVVTQPPESTIPETDNPIEEEEESVEVPVSSTTTEESVEVPVSSTTTEEIVSVTYIPAIGPTGIEVLEQATSLTTHEQTSNELHEQQATISQASATSSSAHSHEEVAVKVDTPTTVASKVAYVPGVVKPIPTTTVVVGTVPVVHSTPVVVQTVPIVPANPPVVNCVQPSTVVEVPTSHDTFTFGADIQWIAKSSGDGNLDNIEAANVTEEVVAKSANVESENLPTPEVNGAVDVEGKHAQVDFDEIVPKNANVDLFIAELLSKLVSDEDVAASADGVFAKNADVDAADSKPANEEVVAKNVVVETESSQADVEEAAGNEEVVAKNADEYVDLNFLDLESASLM